MTVFAVGDRDRVRERVLDLADRDDRVVAAAVVGSLADGDGDRWSDLDLTFAVAGGVPVDRVLEDWTRTLADELGAVRLFDLPSDGAIYRVFLLPGCLQLDLSFARAAAFGAAGPRFRLLFGDAVEKPQRQPPPAEELFGYAVHHALRARFCIERGRLWQAEYWTSAARDYALALACRRRGLSASHGRGYDDLPAEVRRAFADALPRSLDPDELLRALEQSIEGLLREAGDVPALAARVEPELRTLTAPWPVRDDHH